MRPVIADMLPNSLNMSEEPLEFLFRYRDVDVERGREDISLRRLEELLCLVFGARSDEIPECYPIAHGETSLDDSLVFRVPSQHEPIRRDDVVSLYRMYSGCHPLKCGNDAASNIATTLEPGNTRIGRFPKGGPRPNLSSMYNV
jgi:hypothetical protein